MKKGIMIFGMGILGVLTVLQSCKKSTMSFTNTTMTSWFSNHCNSCHGSGGSNKGSWYYNPTDYDGSIKSNIGTLYQVIYSRKSMPPGGMSSAELAKFKSWYDAGYPAN